MMLGNLIIVKHTEDVHIAYTYGFIVMKQNFQWNNGMTAK